MGMPDFESVDAYLEAQDADVARVLREVRATIRKAIPKADESISYKIPTYKLDDTAIVFFAAWKKHWSLYPITALVTSTLARELAAYEVQNGTVKFPYDEAPPKALITRIATLRAREAAAKATSKTKSAKTKNAKTKNAKAKTAKTKTAKAQAKRHAKTTAQGTSRRRR